MMSIKLFGILLLCAAVTIDAQEVFGNFQTVDVDELPSPRELRDLLADIFITPNTRVQMADALDQLPNILSSAIVDMIPVRIVARNPRVTKPSFRKLVDAAIKSIRDNVVSVSVAPEKPTVRPPKPPTPKPKPKPTTKPVGKPKPKPVTPAKPKKPVGSKRPGKPGRGGKKGRGGKRDRKDRKWSDDAVDMEDDFDGRRGRDEGRRGRGEERRERGEGRRGRGERREERRERNPRFRQNNRFNGLGGGVGAAPLLGGGLGLGGLLF